MSETNSKNNNTGKSPHEWFWLSESSEQTEKFGFLLGKLAKANDVISLDGDLGAGKTALTRGIAGGLGLKGYVNSPTFTILMEHRADESGRIPLFHFDAYRLADAEAFYEGGFDEYLGMGGLTVVEWGELIADALPEMTLFIKIERTDYDKPDQRKFSLSWPGCPERLTRVKEKFEDENIGC
jgi:tRNA threonylcarbamoyladenosine biosynthesis protein TsaE